MGIYKVVSHFSKSFLSRVYLRVGMINVTFADIVQKVVVPRSQKNQRMVLGAQKMVVLGLQKKRIFEKISFLQMSQKNFYALLAYFVGTWNVL